MVSAVSRQVDQLEAEIKAHRKHLETVEDRYFEQRRQLEIEGFRLDDLKHDLDRYYDEKYEELSSYLRQEEDDNAESLMTLNQIIEEYRDATEQSYRKERQLLEDKEDQLRQAYQKEHHAVEDKIEACSKQRKRLLLG